MLLLLLLSSATFVRAQEAGRYGHYDVYDPDLPSRADYAKRRAEVLSRLSPGTAMLVRAGELLTRSNDVSFQFRQRNSMLYLTGVTEPESALLLVPGGITIDGKKSDQILFVADRNPTMEVWLGIRMGPEAASQVIGVETTLSYSRLGEVLELTLPAITSLYYDNWLHAIEREPLTGTAYVWEREMRKTLKSKYPRLAVKPVKEILDEMRVIKSESELSQLKRAIDISIEGHRQTIMHARAGMHEYELEAMMEYQFMRLGAEYAGYPSIVGSGPNSCILHYESNRRKTVSGDLVVMDCGAEYHGYTADITRTIPINGTFTPEQRAIYDLVLEAQIAGIDACRPGNDFRLPHRKAVDIIGAGLLRLGIIKHESDYDKYFMHGTSHYIGLDVHDVGNTGALKKGGVMTVEPGIYIPAGSDCDPKWWNIGVRIEDDIVITDDAPLNLSASLPRTADEIEALMRGTNNQ